MYWVPKVFIIQPFISATLVRSGVDDITGFYCTRIHIVFRRYLSDGGWPRRHGLVAGGAVVAGEALAPVAVVFDVAPAVQARVRLAKVDADGAVLADVAGRTATVVRRDAVRRQRRRRRAQAARRRRRRRRPARAAVAARTRQHVDAHLQYQKIKKNKTKQMTITTWNLHYIINQSLFFLNPTSKNGRNSCSTDPFRSGSPKKEFTNAMLHFFTSTNNTVLSASISETKSETVTVTYRTKPVKYLIVVSR